MIDIDFRFVRFYLLPFISFYLTFVLMLLIYTQMHCSTKLLSGKPRTDVRTDMAILFYYVILKIIASMRAKLAKLLVGNRLYSGADLRCTTKFL